MSVVLLSLLFGHANAFLGNTLPLHLFAVEAANENITRGDIGLCRHREIAWASHFASSRSEVDRCTISVRRVPPYFSYKLERIYRVGAGGSVNLTCVAVGFPMPRVFWKKSDDGKCAAASALICFLVTTLILLYYPATVYSAEKTVWSCAH